MYEPKEGEKIKNFPECVLRCHPLATTANRILI